MFVHLLARNLKQSIWVMKGGAGAGRSIFHHPVHIQLRIAVFAVKLRLKWLLLLGGVISLSLGHAQRAAAIQREALVLLTTPLEPALFQPGEPTLDSSVITPDRINQTGLTPPSLWWMQEQIQNLDWVSEGAAPGCPADQFSRSLLNYWLVYPGAENQPRRVDLLVDRDIWVTCNYLQRYVLVQRFGRAAQDFGYSTRVFNLQGELLAAYICDFSGVTGSDDFNPANRDAACSLFLNAYGRGAVRGNTIPFGASPPTPGGTGSN